MNNSIDDTKLRAVFDRIVSEEARKRETAEAIKEIYVDAKSQGFDVPALKETVKAYWVAQDEAKKRKLSEKMEIADVYKRACQIELPF